MKGLVPQGRFVQAGFRVWGVQQGLGLRGHFGLFWSLFTAGTRVAGPCCAVFGEV